MGDGQPRAPGLEPARRYERELPGELIHIDVKKLVHVAIDDVTRLAYAEVLADKNAITVVSFLRRAIAFFERHGIRVRRLLTITAAGSAPPSTP